jgi:hypothetical protein
MHKPEDEELLQECKLYCYQHRLQALEKVINMFMRNLQIIVTSPEKTYVTNLIPTQIVLSDDPQRFGQGDLYMLLFRQNTRDWRMKLYTRNSDSTSREHIVPFVPQKDVGAAVARWKAFLDAPKFNQTWYMTTFSAWEMVPTVNEHVQYVTGTLFGGSPIMIRSDNIANNFKGGSRTRSDFTIAGPNTSK